MDEFRKALGNASAVAIIGFALVLAFGAPILNGLVDVLKWLGAN